MILFVRFFYRAFNALEREIRKGFSNICGNIILRVQGARIGKNITLNGLPKIDVSRSGVLIIGDNFTMNSGPTFNQIGRNQRSYLVVGHNSELVIGNNVGISSTAIICHKKITIGDNVKIGGNTVIYDSDFHSLDPLKRSKMPEDTSDVGKAAVEIGDNVFIGAHSTVLKGVKIGNNAVIGAGSVVTKDVPQNEIWGGNPARMIKKIFE